MTTTEELIEMSRQTRAALTGERDSNNIITAGARQSMAFLARVERELARVVTLERERDELRAIVDGREEPPTDAEIVAHHAAGGSWLAAGNHGRVLTRTMRDVRNTRDYLAAHRMTATWWALDDESRPCAWPKVTP